MEKKDDRESRDEIFNLFIKWRDTSKNEQAPLAITLMEKISETIPESYGIKIEESNMRYFVLLTDSDFINCNTQPFTCVYEFCQYLENFHQKEDDWYDTLLPHCLPGSSRQEWIAYNLYQFKFSWKQVCYRLMQKYDSPSRRSNIDKTIKEMKFDSSQSIEKFNDVFNAHIDELFYDEQTAIQIYKRIIPGEYANMLSTTTIIDEGSSFIYTLADIQQRITDIVNASDNDFVCYTGISHNVYTTNSESIICCQDQHSIGNCPDTFVLQWPKNDPRNKRNGVGEKSKPISSLPKTTKTETKQTPSNMPSVEPSVVPSPLKPVVSPVLASVSSTAAAPSKPSSNPSSISHSIPSSKVQNNTLSSNQSPSSSVTKPKPSVPYNSRPIVSQNNAPLKRQPSPPFLPGNRFPPTVKKSKITIKCRNCGDDYTYGHSNVCPNRGGRTISRTR